MDTKRIIQVLNISINVGYKINQMKGVVPDYGKVWCHYKAIENIFSLTNLVKKFRFAYDSHKDDALVVHTNIIIIKFRRNNQGLYVFNTKYTTENSNVVTTVE